METVSKYIPCKGQVRTGIECFLLQGFTSVVLLTAGCICDNCDIFNGTNEDMQCMFHVCSALCREHRSVVCCRMCLQKLHKKDKHKGSNHFNILSVCALCPYVGELHICPFIFLNVPRGLYLVYICTWRTITTSGMFLYIHINLVYIY